MKRTHPGRPPLTLGETSTPVNVRLSSAQYDDTYERAQRARVSVPEQIRRDMREAERRSLPRI
jgi:hypothetical protein